MRGVRDLVCAIAINRARALDCALNFDRDIDLVIARALDCALDLDRDIDLVVARAIDLVFNPNLDLHINRVRALYHISSIWINLITLQERIAGRSPAFEGIRLVKERKPE